MLKPDKDRKHLPSNRSRKSGPSVGNEAAALIPDRETLLPFYNGTEKPTPRIQKHILSIQDLQFHMEFIPGKENPVDGSSRHPEDIAPWSEEGTCKHGVDDGEEIRQSRVLAVGSLDSILEVAGLTGGHRCSEQETAEVGAQDAEYSLALALVRERKLNFITGEYKEVANELSSDGNFMLRDSRIVVPFGSRSASPEGST